MCHALSFHYQSQVFKRFFASPRATVAVVLKNGESRLLPWGRRQNEAGNLPLGGWAKHADIQLGKWDKYFPRPVKIPALAFMEKNIEGHACWFDVIAGQYLQGLVAHYDSECRVYIVTISPEKEDALFERWPRLVNNFSK